MSPNVATRNGGVLLWLARGNYPQFLPKSPATGDRAKEDLDLNVVTCTLVNDRGETPGRCGPKNEFLLRSNRVGTREISLRQFRGTTVFLKDDWIYLWLFGNVVGAAIGGTYDWCLVKHAVGVDAATLGRDVLVALHALERDMSMDEFHSRPDPVLSATGYKSHRQLRKARDLVWVSQVTPEADIWVIAGRNKGPNTFPMNEEQVSLPRDVAEKDLGECVAQQLARSREINT
jgi:hypothetical protein